MQTTFSSLTPRHTSGLWRKRRGDGERGRQSMGGKRWRKEERGGGEGEMKAVGNRGRGVRGGEVD